VGAPADDQYADTDPGALTDFRPALDPYGSWADDPSYGTVWTPNPDDVGPGFQPYDTGGQWDYDGTDYSWVSSYAWGWVCFHYGRWVWSGARGWVWIPGRDYAPAWVTWRLGDDGYPYVGWAPVAPSWIWIGGSATLLDAAPAEPWTFTGRGDVLSPSVGSHAVTGAQAAAILPHSKPYVPATPGVAAPPAPHGPPPALLGIDPARIAHLALSVRELRARQFARPSTALPLGAHPPIPHVVRAPRTSAGAGAIRGGPPHGAGGRGRR
jgi:hypothetical protein